VKDDTVGFIRKYLSADGLLKVVKHGLHREQFKVVKNSEYSWADCIMSGLAIFGFKLPSLKAMVTPKMTVSGMPPSGYYLTCVASILISKFLLLRMG
jgi:hypothetical protein